MDIKTVAEYIKEIKEAEGDLATCHQHTLDSDLLAAYRGEPRDYGGSSLMPSLFRTDGYIQKEPHLFELFCDYNIVSSGASNIEKAIEAQHYASISRMLDISFNALIALYFACNLALDDDNDGYVFAFAFPEHYSPHSKYIEEFYTNVLSGEHTAYARNFKVFSHTYANDRIKAQKGGFVFFPGAEFSPINSCYYRRITVHKEDKAQLREDLNILFQINEATVFPEKDKIASVVKEKFQRNRYSSRQVSVQDEIDTYFSRINYELALPQPDSTQTKKSFLRVLRKEEDDILHYIDTTVLDGPKESLKEQASRNFLILRIPFIEVQNGN